MPEIENSEIIKKILITVLNISGRKTSEGYAVSVMDSLIKKLEGTYDFLKKCLLQVKEDEPFRGPRNFRKGDFSYQMMVNGDLNDFSGEEKIFFKGKEVFRQYFVGGMIIQK